MPAQLPKARPPGATAKTHDIKLTDGTTAKTIAIETPHKHRIKVSISVQIEGARGTGRMVSHVIEPDESSAEIESKFKRLAETAATEAIQLRAMQGLIITPA